MLVKSHSLLHVDIVLFTAGIYNVEHKNQCNKITKHCQLNSSTIYFYYGLSIEQIRRISCYKILVITLSRNNKILAL